MIGSIHRKILFNYEVTIIRSLFLYLYGLFMPIFIYHNSSSIEIVAIYLLFMSFFDIFNSLAVTKLIEKLGIEVTQSLSMVLNFLKVFLLLAYDGSIQFTLFLSYMSSLSLSLYWIPFYTYFTLFGKKGEVAREIAIVNIIVNLISIASPTIAGILITLFGYKNYYFTSIIFLLITIALIIKGSEHKTVIKIEFKSRPKYAINFILNGVIVSTTTILNFYLFYVSKSVTYFGIVNSVAILLLVILNYFIASRVDKLRDYSVGSVGILLFTNVVTLIYFSKDPVLIGILLTVLKLTSPLYSLPLYGIIYRISREHGLDQIVYRRMLLSIGRSIVYSTFLIFGIEKAILLSIFILMIWGVIFHFSFSRLS